MALVVINDRTLVCTGSSDAMPCYYMRAYSRPATNDNPKTILYKQIKAIVRSYFASLSNKYSAQRPKTVATEEDVMTCVRSMCKACAFPIPKAIFATYHILAESITGMLANNENLMDSLIGYPIIRITLIVHPSLLAPGSIDISWHKPIINASLKDLTRFLVMLLDLLHTYNSMPNVMLDIPIRILLLLTL